jgi:hypothetical protein
LNQETSTIFTSDEYSSAFANTIDNLFSEGEGESVIDEILKTTAKPGSVIEDLTPPFVFVERGPGGHAPYGEYSGSGWEYYRERGASPRSRFKQEYETSVRRDVKYFRSQVAKLDDRGLLDETLIIYTSDHGELLGERGCVGHNTPIHPKLTYVPTVLFHPSISPGHKSEGVLRHIDFYPTISGMLEQGIDHLPGRDLTTDRLAERGTSHYRKNVFPDSIPIFSGEIKYDSVWDQNGGHVFPRTSRHDRAAVLAGKLLKGAKRTFMWDNLGEVVRFYLEGKQKYYEPDFDESEAESNLRQIEKLQKSGSTRIKLDAKAKNRLEELGYMN